MPSSLIDGGMRMSVSTTSGCCISIAVEERREVRVRADDLDVRLAGEHLLQAFPNE